LNIFYLVLLQKNITLKGDIGLLVIDFQENS